VIGERYGSRRFARRFDRLRRYQRARESIVARIGAIRDMRGARVVELGAGTGVVTEELARQALSVAAFDRSSAMIAIARERNLPRCSFALADHRDIPLADGCADLVLAAWSLDGVVYDNSNEESDDGNDNGNAGGEVGWRTALDRTVQEMERLAAAGGAVVIVASPIGARDIAGHLERAHGFRRRLFKTAWRFPSRWAARAAVKLFFGARVWRDYRPRWPRDLVTLAGLWWRTG
jgi:SAM-dependent methyltransferase